MARLPPEARVIIRQLVGEIKSWRSAEQVSPNSSLPPAASTRRQAAAAQGPLEEAGAAANPTPEHDRKLVPSVECNQVVS